MDNEMAEFEVNFLTNMPAGSKGILTAIPFPGWNKPKLITKKELDEAIETFKNNPDIFKKDVPRW